MTANLGRWSMIDALHATNPRGFDNLAAGDDLAYRYGLRGTLAGISVGVAQTALGNAQFGSAAQPLSAFDALGQGAVKLG